jgi:hypothetical protein
MTIRKWLFEKKENPVMIKTDSSATAKADVVDILKAGNTFTTTKKTQPSPNMTVIWQNPYSQGTPEAREESLRLIMEAMLYGLPPVDDEQTQRINEMRRDVLSGKAKLADFRRLLGTLH